MDSRELTKSPDRKAGSQGRRRLRKGFSTGTAMTAAARAALRHCLTQEAPEVVAVRLPSGWFYPVLIHECRLEEGGASAVVVKDGGDDPDVTHGAWVHAHVQSVPPSFPHGFPEEGFSNGGLWILGGKGVGRVSKAGLPVGVGEPAINPVPRTMLLQNLVEEMKVFFHKGASEAWKEWPPCRRGNTINLLDTAIPRIFLPFDKDTVNGSFLSRLFLAVLVQIPRGEELARHTLNPRLGILGGISILGTTGIVRPLSHEAYEETIGAALSVAASSGCPEVVLSTGGKSEQFAQKSIPDLPTEAFIQIADFFAFSVGKARDMGFWRITHSVFFGKVVKMAQGHSYTHAHKAEMDLGLLADEARALGYPDPLCRELAEANTARHALEILQEQDALDVVHSVARRALEQSARLAGATVRIRLLLFDYDGTLLTDDRT